MLYVLDILQFCQLCLKIAVKRGKRSTKLTKLVRLTIKKRDKNKICKIRNEERDLTTNFVEIKRLTIEYY